MKIALLTERLRVEERLLLDAFASRGHEAEVVAPSRLSVNLARPAAPGWPLAVQRAPSRGEHAALLALLAAQGVAVINRPATARLLADRLALLRHLVFAGIPVPETIASFGETATFAAIEALGYPVLLKSLSLDAAPLALIEDRDAAEAVIEHRGVLGGEQAVLVQRFAAGQGRSERLAIVGSALLGVETRRHHGWRPGREAPYAPYEGDISAHHELAQRLVERLGSGCYSIEVVADEDGQCVVGAENLTDFRSLSEAGIDVAGAIADFALEQARSAGGASGG
ncbi:MAG TPA: hypothetical protein VFI42_16980 [Thermomicrobiaceae bacterium]|nr:hypothetical protein [Thermomicrobiaceae bacterium]